MLRNCTYLQIFERGTPNSRRYCEKEPLPNVYLFSAAVSPEIIFMDNSARPNRTAQVKELLTQEVIQRMEWFPRPESQRARVGCTG